MKAIEITITSKNQITIPADVVRQLKLHKKRILELRVKDNSILLTPEQSIEDAMRPFWTKHHAKQAISDEELKQAIRHGMAKRAAAK